MPRTSDRRALLVGIVLVLCSGCVGPASTFTLLLAGSADAPLPDLGALKVVVRDPAQMTPEVFGPFAIDRTGATRLPAWVAPTSTFTVDVWGCAQVERCAPADRLARGCRQIMLDPNQEDPAVVVVTLYPEDDARSATCAQDSDS